MAPKSVTFRRHDHLVSVRFAQPFLQHYIFNVFGSCTILLLIASSSYKCSKSYLTPNDIDSILLECDQSEGRRPCIIHTEIVTTGLSWSV